MNQEQRFPGIPATLNDYQWRNSDKSIKNIVDHWFEEAVNHAFDMRPKLFSDVGTIHEAGENRFRGREGLIQEDP